jgi:hypothetical protein
MKQIHVLDLDEGLSPEKEDEIIKQFVADQMNMRAEMDRAVEAAQPALKRLCEVLSGRSGQPYKLRNILYALYTGRPTKFEIVNFDWAIRKDLLAVCLAFGADDFFYAELKAAIMQAGQWDWFIEEGGKDGSNT